MADRAFGWLTSEVLRIKTRKFHMFQPLTPKELDLVQTHRSELPDSYVDFVLQFGCAQLYRLGSGYQVVVKALPQQITTRERNLQFFGFSDDARAYFSDSESHSVSESPVYEWDEDELTMVADGFANWLVDRCNLARAQYTPSQWRQILDGPPPFNTEEQHIVVARKYYRWRLIGIAPNGDLMFEVKNDSNMKIPFLSLGLRSTDGKFEGSIALSVGHLAPRESGIIVKPCYTGIIAPDQLFPFDLPDPGPEDRHAYWEFRTRGDTSAN